MQDKNLRFIAGFRKAELCIRVTNQTAAQRRHDNGYIIRQLYIIKCNFVA